MVVVVHIILSHFRSWVDGLEVLASPMGLVAVHACPHLALVDEVMVA